MSTADHRRPGRPLDPSKRAAIIEASARSFFANGFAASSIEAIAADAGVSKVTIYNQFGDKRALFAAAVEHECEKMRASFDIGEMPRGSIRERLTAIAETFAAFLSRPEIIRFEHRIAAETEKEPALGKAFLSAGPWRMKAAFGAFLAQADASGELRVEDPELAAEQFVSMCKGMGDLERRFGIEVNEEDHARRIAGAVEVFLRAYSRD